MTTRQTVKEAILANGRKIGALGVSKIGLFGSLSREEQNEGSDVDIIVDFAEGQETFDNLMAVSELLEAILGRGVRVDLVTLKGLSPYIGPHILKEVQYVEISN
jgi:Predicted nucleotidyltransferases